MRRRSAEALCVCVLRTLVSLAPAKRETMCRQLMCRVEGDPEQSRSRPHRPPFGVVSWTLRDMVARAEPGKETHPGMLVTQRLFQRQAPVAQPRERAQRQHVLGAADQRRGRGLVEARTCQPGLLPR